MTADSQQEMVLWHISREMPNYFTFDICHYVMNVRAGKFHLTTIRLVDDHIVFGNQHPGSVIGEAKYSISDPGLLDKIREHLEGLIE